MSPEAEGTPAAPPNIYQRMIVAMQNVSYVQKTKSAALKYSAVTHDDVTAKCRGALAEAGIYAYPEIVEVVTAQFIHVGYYDGKQQESKYIAMTMKGLMHFVNADTPADRISIMCVGVGIDKEINQDKCPGKAFSYLCKYGFLKGLMLETGDDPDLEQSRDEPKPPSPARAAMNAAAKVTKAKNDSNFGEPIGGDPLPGSNVALIKATIKALCESTGDRESEMSVRVKEWIKEEFAVATKTEYAALSLDKVNKIQKGIWAVFAPRKSREPGEEPVDEKEQS